MTETRKTEYVDGRTYLGPEMQRYTTGIRRVMPELYGEQVERLARYVHDEVSAAREGTWQFLQGEDMSV